MGQTSRRRPSIQKIAQIAGVSRATVDRVVNDRAGVQPHTRTHVLSAIAELTGDLKPTGGQLAPEMLNLDFIIPDRGNAFLARQALQLEDVARRRDNVGVTIHRPDAGVESGILMALEHLAATSGGIGIVGLDSHKVREAIRLICRRQVPVVTLASDIRNVPRTAYVGIDNHAAGRLAGYLTGRMLGDSGGKTALVLGSRAYLGHEEREMGFRAVLRESFPALRIVDEREALEDADFAYQEVLALLSKHQDLEGIYCIGAGQSGVARALIDSGRERSVLFVCHGLSADTRPYLGSRVIDVVIDENVRLEAELAIDVLVAAARGTGDATVQEVPICPIFAENLPTE